MKKKLIRLTESDLHRMVKECVKHVLNKNVLTETHMQTLYHFVSPKQLQYIARYGFKLNNLESNFSINPKLPNCLCFSRNRNGVQGFPYMNSKYSGGGGTCHNETLTWMIIRLEIDAEKLNQYGKVKPFDYIHHFNKEECENSGYYYGDYPQSGREETAMLATNTHPNFINPSDEEIYNQPFSQAEDRLFSALKKIPKEESLKLIKRIDIWLDFGEMQSNSILKSKFNTFSNWLFDKFGNTPIYIYRKINEFNIQTKPSINTNLFWDWIWGDSFDYYYNREGKNIWY